MYDACRFARQIVLAGRAGLGLERPAHRMSIPAEFTALKIDRLPDPGAREALPAQGLEDPRDDPGLPWIARLYPDIKYIFWIRDPRDSIIGQHKTDDLADFGVPYEPTDDLRRRRAISWIYQYKLVRATPRPKNWIEVRLEDFVLRQEETLARLEDYLGIPLARIPVKPEVIGRWRTDAETHYFDFFEPAMREYGYEFAEPLVPAPPEDR